MVDYNLLFVGELRIVFNAEVVATGGAFGFRS